MIIPGPAAGAVVRPIAPPDRPRHRNPDLAAIGVPAREAIDAGVTHVYIHQIGPDQDAFLDLARTVLLPALRGWRLGSDGMERIA